MRTMLGQSRTPVPTILFVTWSNRRIRIRSSSSSLTLPCIDKFLQAEGVSHYVHSLVVAIFKNLTRENDGKFLILTRERIYVIINIKSWIYKLNMKGKKE